VLRERSCVLQMPVDRVLVEWVDVAVGFHKIGGCDGMFESIGEGQVSDRIAYSAQDQHVLILVCVHEVEAWSVTLNGGSDFEIQGQLPTQLSGVFLFCFPASIRQKDEWDVDVLEESQCFSGVWEDLSRSMDDSINIESKANRRTRNQLSEMFSPHCYIAGWNQRSLKVGAKNQLHQCRILLLGCGIDSSI
jgi:hypothetical protein